MMKHVTFVGFVVLSALFDFSQSQNRIPSTALAQEALTDFLQLVNPFARPSHCLFLTTTLAQIRVDSAIVAVAARLANLFYQNMLNLENLLNAGDVLITEGTEFIFFESLPVTADVYPEVGPHTTAIYTSSRPVPGCISARQRIENDALGKNCDESSYESYQIGGACLNKDNPGAGLANREMPRIGDPFCTLDGHNSECQLPSSRDVSLAISTVLNVAPAGPEFIVPNLVSLYYQQFVAHESTQAGLNGAPVGATPRAGCGYDRRPLWNKLNSPSVNGIPVRCTDPFYSQFDLLCLHFGRNRRMNENCAMQEANFMNTATAILDLNTIYEIFDHPTGTLKSTQGVGGKLKTDSNGEIIIPYPTDKQHSLVTMIAILFTKLHNAIVDELKRIRPWISDDKAFKTAQKILVAMHQHVFYNEILPTIIGHANDLVGNTDDIYDEKVVPQILQEYSSAAGRFTHTLVPVNVTIADCTTYETLETIRTRDTYNATDLAFERFQGLICGSTATPWNTGPIASDVQNFLFYDHKLGYGHDIFAIDNERHRDACSEPYINYVRRISDKCVRSWSDIEDRFPEGTIPVFQRIYQRVEDLDLYPAGILEKFVPGGSIMGPIFTNITVQQFKIIKAGDPKFYTHSLTPQQMDQVKQVGLDDFLCIGAGLNKTIRDAQYRLIRHGNPVVDCRCRTFNCFDLSVFL